MAHLDGLERDRIEQTRDSGEVSEVVHFPTEVPAGDSEITHIFETSIRSFLYRNKDISPQT